MKLIYKKIQHLNSIKSMEKLTEDNIKDYGFELSSKMKYYHNYKHPDLKSVLRLCVTPYENISLLGSWYYGFEEWVQIDTVEELKALYKLVTKKELIQEVKKVILCWCDDCGKELSTEKDLDNKEAYDEYLTNQGWSPEDGGIRTMCPNCAERYFLGTPH